jgi:hypothetical protein
LTLAPGGDIAKALRALPPNDRVLDLYPGAHYPPALISRVHDWELRGRGAIIEGAPVWGLKIDHCRNVAVSELLIPDAGQYGVMVVRCGRLVSDDAIGRDPSRTGVRIARVTVHRAGTTGILTANTSDLLIEECVCNWSLEQWGIYVSQSGDRVRILRNRCANNARGGIQVNANQPNRKKLANDDGKTIALEIVGNVLNENQSQGGAAINLAGVRRATVTGNVIARHRGQHFVSMWNDNTGNPELACHHVEIRGNVGTWHPDVKHGAAVSIGEGCSHIEVGANDWRDR